MDLNHLRSFVAVAKFGHLTRASEALHLSQPALSSHIKTLEEQFGVTLFERTPTGMTLTPSGRRLLVEAEQIIGAVRAPRPLGAGPARTADGSPQDRDGPQSGDAARG